MASENFFKLDRKHKVISDFAEDHYKAIKAYQKSYAYFKNHKSEKKEELTYQEAIDFYKALATTKLHLEETYINLIISYYNFKKAANEDEVIRKEFTKLPADFSPIEDFIKDILECYDTALENMKKIL